MRRHRRAKIVATLGPASSNPEMLARLFQAGADVFRINMSHTSQDRMRELVAMIRALEKDNDRPIGILVDLQGPKLRLGTFNGGSVQLSKGDTFTLLFTPDVYGVLPELDSTVEWGGATLTVRTIQRIAPDGVAVAARIGCSR